MIKKRMIEMYNIVKDKGYDIFAIFLQGSQNYMLDYKDSDIDTKCIVLPSFDDICRNRQPVSTTIKLDNGEQIDVKDIRIMFNNFKKQNINYLEILFSKEIIYNTKYEKFLDKLKERREDIARYDINKALNCMAGMSMQKYKALTHPYPTIKHKIDKFGYDPKQLHHILRLSEFALRYSKGENFSDCLISEERDFLIKVKKGEAYNLEKAKEIADVVNMHTLFFVRDFNKNNIRKKNEEVSDFLNNLIVEIFKAKFRSEL